MVRPCYPSIYQEDQIESSRKCHEVAVIVSNDWKMGDLVDWWADNVHWCGEVIQLLDPGKAKVSLLLLLLILIFDEFKSLKSIVSCHWSCLLLIHHSPMLLGI